MRRMSARVLLVVIALLGLPGRAGADSQLDDVPPGGCVARYAVSCSFEATGSVGELVAGPGGYLLFGDNVYEEGPGPETKLISGLNPGSIYYLYANAASFTSHPGSIDDAKHVAARERKVGVQEAGVVIHGCSPGLEPVVCVDALMHDRWTLWWNNGFLCTANGDGYVGVHCWTSQQSASGYGTLNASASAMLGGPVPYREWTLCVQGWHDPLEGGSRVWTDVFCRSVLDPI